MVNQEEEIKKKGRIVLGRWLFEALRKNIILGDLFPEERILARGLLLALE